MLNMSQINHIKDLHQSGYRISEIEKETGMDHKTISKYISQEDFSNELLIKNRKGSILDPFKPTITSWLEEDKKHWYKQHHTAMRVFNRLTAECGYKGGYSIVQRYLKVVHEDQKKQHGNQELVWEPGFAQVDFGEADFYEDNKCIRKKYLVVSFPYSNDGYCQVFGGETAECVCQGLQDIFWYIGGVPPVLIFDNATGVGRRIKDVIHESDIFSRFRAHCHFQVRFCNPASGWEKGNVERKVGYERSNLFVPAPHYKDITGYNKTLLGEHETKASELHYKKQEEISRLFEADKAALMALPSKKFNVCRYEQLAADGYGKICLDGKHYYSTCPEYSGRKDVTVGIRAHFIDVYDRSGNLLVRHDRQFGADRTDSSDYSTTLAVLSHSAGAWQNSGVRKEVTDPLREYMDGLPKPILKNCLAMMNELTGTYGFMAAVKAMDMALRDNRISASDAKIIAERITGYGIDTPSDSGPSLDVYDKAFLPAHRGGTAI